MEKNEKDEEWKTVTNNKWKCSRIGKKFHS